MSGSNIDYDTAIQKLANPPQNVSIFRTESLPVSVQNPLWSSIASTYGLQLCETSALQIKHCQDEGKLDEQRIETIVQRIMDTRFPLIESSPATPITPTGGPAQSATTVPIYIRAGNEVRLFRPASKARRYAEHIRSQIRTLCPHGHVEFHRRPGLHLYFLQPTGQELVHHCPLEHRAVKDLAFALGLCGWQVATFKDYKAACGGNVPSGGEISPEDSDISTIPAGNWPETFSF